MAKPKKQINGKIETYEPTSLDQIFGDTGLSRYKTLDINEYEASLEDMNVSDLQKHAYKMGLMPIDDKKMLKKRLLVAFKVYINDYKRPKTQPVKPLTVTKEVKKILSEGQ